MKVPTRKQLLRIAKIGAIGIGGFVIVAAALLLLNRQRINDEIDRPLGPTLAPFDAQVETTQSAESTPLPTVGEGTQSDVVVEATAGPEPLCNGPAQMMVLAIGADTQDSEIRGLADVIRVVRIDFVTPSISVLTIPRDTWVPIPGLGEHGPKLRDYFGYAYDENGQPIVTEAYYGRINVAYFYGNLYDLPGGGAGVLNQTIYNSFGLTADHYVAVNMEMLGRIVDSVGGIEVDVPEPIPGFNAGVQQMNGDRALEYARHRKSDNDWYRAERQNIVLMALREKMLQPQVFPRLPQIANTMLDDTVTDFSKRDISSLICLLQHVDRDSVTSYAISPSMVRATSTQSGSYVLIPNQERVDKLIAEFMGEQAPE